MSGRRGSTLLELLVALAVIGVALGVASVAMRAEPGPDAATRRRDHIAAIRRRAVATGAPQALWLHGDTAPLTGIVYPDGRVLLDDASLVDGMSGRPDAR